MNLILLKNAELTKVVGDADSPSILLPATDPRAIHILRHLRKQVGDTVTAGLLNGPQGEATLISIGPKKDLTLQLHFLSTFKNPTPSTADIRSCEEDVRKRSTATTATNKQASYSLTLLVALPFPKRLKSMIPVISSMGVTRIIIVKGRLSNEEYCSSSTLREAVYRPLIEEGMMQGGHTQFVSVDIQVGQLVSKSILQELLADSNEGSTATDSDHDHCCAKIFLDCGDRNVSPPPAREVVLQQFQKHKEQQHTRKRPLHEGSPKQESSGTGHRPLLSAIVAVGPERGWTIEEAACFSEIGFESATLGKSLLRVDTAIVAGLAVVSAAMDECNQQHD